MPLIIDIGSKYIHLVGGRNKDNLKCKSLEIPEGAVVDGEIVKLDEMINLIKGGIKRYCYNKAQVTFLIHTTDMIMKEAILPKAKPKEMQRLMEQEMLGVLVQEQTYLFDYQVLETIDEKTVKLLIVAVPQSVIARYVQLARAIGAKRCKIDLHQNSVSQLIAEQKIKESGSMILAEIGNSMLHLYLFDGKVRIFSTSTPINTEQYRNTLISMGQIRDEGAFNLLDLSPNILEEKPIVYDILMPYLNGIISEIEKVMQFQLGRDSSKPVNTIYIYGGVANMKGIEAYLGSGLLADVLGIEQLVNTFKIGDVRNYITSLGKIYKAHTKEINFYDTYEYVERMSKKVSATHLIGGFVLAGQVIIGMSILSCYVLAGKINYQKAEALMQPYREPDTIVKLQGLYDKSLQIEELKKNSSVLKQEAEKIEALLKLDKTFWDELATKMPSHVEILEVTYQSGVMHLKCKTNLEQEIREFLHYLRTLSRMQDVSYTGYRVEEGNYYFELDLIFEEGGQE